MSSLLNSLGIDPLGVAQRIQPVEDIWDNIASASEHIPLIHRPGARGAA